MAQVCRIVIYGYFKFWQKKNTEYCVFCTGIIKDHFSEFLPAFFIVYAYLFSSLQMVNLKKKKSFYTALQICVKRECIQ